MIDKTWCFVMYRRPKRVLLQHATKGSISLLLFRGSCNCHVSRIGRLQQGSACVFPLGVIVRTRLRTTLFHAGASGSGPSPSAMASSSQGILGTICGLASWGGGPSEQKRSYPTTDQGDRSLSRAHSTVFFRVVIPQTVLALEGFLLVS